MKKIAITGNIASGKSTVENIISECGFKVVDTDLICHQLINRQDVKEQIALEFSDRVVFDENNNIDRKALGEIVFNNETLKKTLENILHPLVKIEVQKFAEKNKTEKFIFVSVPLLFEAKMHGDYDKVILVVADDKVRQKRLMERNDFSTEQALARINAQIPQENKTRLSDYIVDNNGSLRELKLQVEGIIKLLG